MKSKQFVFLLLDQINFDFRIFCLSLRRVAIIDTYSQLLSHYNFDHIHKNHYITTINMLADLLMIRVIIIVVVAIIVDVVVVVVIVVVIVIVIVIVTVKIY